MTNHEADVLHFVEDVSHEGEPVVLPAPSFDGPPVGVLRARLAQWPYGGDTRPYISLEVTDDGECAELDRRGALAVARLLRAHAAVVEELAATLDG